MGKVNKNTALALIAFVLVFLILVLSYLLLLLKNERGSEGISGNSDYNQQPVDINTQGKYLPVQLSVNSDKWMPGEINQLYIYLANGEDSLYPDAFTLNIKYDPEMVKLVRINKGYLWSDVNVLEETIDEESGMAVVSHGASFDSEVVGGVQLVILDFEAVSGASGQTSISIESGSEAGKVGLDYLYPIISEPVLFSISENTAHED